MTIEIEKPRKISLIDILKVIGNKISFARKQSKKKIDSVSRALKIRSEYLLAIEEGDIKKLPEEVYLKGFIKSYAKYFNIDISDELVLLISNFDQSKDEDLEKKKSEIQIDSLPNLKIIFIVVVSFFLVFFSWNEYKKKINKRNGISIQENVELHENPPNGISEKQNMDGYKNYTEVKDLNTLTENNVQTNSDLKIMNDFEKEQLESSDNKENNFNKFDSQTVKVVNKIKLMFFDTTWMQIRSIDGEIFKSGIFNDGDLIFLEIDDQNSNYFLDTGNAGGFKLFLNNEELPLIGQLGSVRKDISLLDFFNQDNNFQ